MHFKWLTKGSKAVSDVTYAEALVAEQNDSEKEAVTSWVDSDGNAITVDSIVRVSDEVSEGTWDDEAGKWTQGRDFDFGVVVALSPDGTVSVEWDAAMSGCSCLATESSRGENPSELTVSNETEQEWYRRGYLSGVEKGGEELKEELQDFLKSW